MNEETRQNQTSLKPFDERLEGWLRKVFWAVLLLGCFVLTISGIGILANQYDELEAIRWFRELSVIDFMRSTLLVFGIVFIGYSLACLVCVEFRSRRKRRERP